MRIHSDKIEYADLCAASQRAVVTFSKVDRKGSRSRDHAWEIKLLGDSPYAPGFGGGEPGDHAASWDQWGIFLAELFKIDSEMTSRNYVDAETFHKITGGRFISLRYGVPPYHRRHKWEPNYNSTASCACGAFQDWNRS